MSELDNIKKREARWAFCLALKNWGESGASEHSLLQISEGMRYGLSLIEVRETILYLQDLGLCTTNKLPTGELWAVRTSKCVDVVEFSAECPAGIARPENKWW